MKYLVVGAGGVGGMISAALALSGADVTVIARGAHLDAIKNNGLRIISDIFGDKTVEISAFSTDEYSDKPDVIFVCTKHYSLPEIIPFLQKVSDENTIVIPVLNVFQVGEELQKSLVNTNVLEGCIYIVSFISGTGVISHPSKIFKIFFGKRSNQKLSEEKLVLIQSNLTKAGIKAYNSDNILRDTFAKVTLISPYAACGAFFDVPLANMQKDGKERDFLINLLTELSQIADKLHLDLGFDVVQRNLDFVDKMPADTISSLHRDIKNNHKTEVDGQIFNIVRLGQKLGLEMSAYKLAAKKFGFEN